MKTIALIVLSLLTLTGTTDAARRKVVCGDCVLIERGSIRELSHRVTTFGSTVRYGRALGGGPRGFSASK